LKKTVIIFYWPMQLDKNHVYLTAVLVFGLLILQAPFAWSLQDGKSAAEANQIQPPSATVAEALSEQERKLLLPAKPSLRLVAPGDNGLPTIKLPATVSSSLQATLFNFSDSVSLMMGSPAEIKAMDPGLEKKLEAPITVDFHGVPCEHVFHLIANMAGLNIVVDPDVKDRSIDMSLNNVPMREVMGLICTCYGLDVITTGHYLYVVDQNKLQQGTFKSIKLNNITAYDAKDLVKGLVHTVNASKESNTIALVGTPGEINRAQDILMSADLSQEQPTASRLVMLNNLNVKEAKDLVKNVITTVDSSNQANSVVLSGTPGQINKAAEILKTADQAQTGETTFKLVKLTNLSVEEAKGLVKDVVTTADTSQEINSIILTGTSGQIQKAVNMLKEADIAQPQVVLEAKIIEIDKNGERDLGIDWPASITNNFQESNRPNTFSTVESGVPNPATIFRLSRSPIEFAATINMLETKGEAKTLSSPSIATLNNKEAQIFVGDSIPYTITTVAGGYASTDVRFVEPGIRLDITPSIIDKDFVVIKIAPEVSYIYSWIGPNNQYPWIKKRNATAYVRVKSNTTFIMGGILSKEDQKNLTGVPMLGKIPLIGNLFKSQDHSTTDSDLIISVTPRVVRNKDL